MNSINDIVECDDIQCGKNYDLTKFEEQIVKILFWSRNKNFGKELSIKYCFHPGPHGIMGKNKVWWPSPCEACNSEVEVFSEKNWNPWNWFIHCKSKEHIIYLVKFRPKYVVYQCIGFGNLLLFLKIMRESKNGEMFYRQQPSRVSLFYDKLDDGESILENKYGSSFELFSIFKEDVKANKLIEFEKKCSLSKFRFI